MYAFNVIRTKPRPWGCCHNTSEQSVFLEVMSSSGEGASRKSYCFPWRSERASPIMPSVRGAEVSPLTKTAPTYSAKKTWNLELGKKIEAVERSSARDDGSGTSCRHGHRGCRSKQPPCCLPERRTIIVEVFQALRVRWTFFGDAAVETE